MGGGCWAEGDTNGWRDAGGTLVTPLAVLAESPAKGTLAGQHPCALPPPPLCRCSARRGMWARQCRMPSACCRCLAPRWASRPPARGWWRGAWSSTTSAQVGTKGVVGGWARWDLRQHRCVEEQLHVWWSACTWSPPAASTSPNACHSALQAPRQTARCPAAAEWPFQETLRASPAITPSRLGGPALVACCGSSEV